MPHLQCHTSDTCQVLHVDTSQIHFFLTASLLANSSDRWLKSKSKWYSFSRANLVKQQASEILSLQDQIQPTLQLQNSRVKILLEHTYSKEQITPHNMPPVEVCPMADSGLSSAHFCSTRNQVTGLHHHFQSEAPHYLWELPRLRKQHEKNTRKQSGPSQNLLIWKELVPVPMCTPYAHSQMRRDALFGSTNILSIRKATK